MSNFQLHPMLKDLGSILCKAAVLGALSLTAHAQGWQPTKSVEFIVPAGTGGGADQMARDRKSTRLNSSHT